MLTHKSEHQNQAVVSNVNISKTVRQNQTVVSNVNTPICKSKSEGGIQFVPQNQTKA